MTRGCCTRIKEIKISGTYKVLTLFIDGVNDIITEASKPSYGDEKPPLSNHAVSSVPSITLKSHFHNVASRQITRFLSGGSD
jgi:hypothetical protein